MVLNIWNKYVNFLKFLNNTFSTFSFLKNENDSMQKIFTEDLKMTLLKVIDQVPRANYIEGAQMLQEQKDEKDSQIGIWCCLKNHNKGFSSKEKEERGFCNRYVLCVCLSLLSENLIKNVLLIFKNVFSINLGAI